MPAYFDYNVKGEHFSLFSTYHLLTLFIVLCLSIFLYLIRNFLKKKPRDSFFRYGLGILLLLSEASYQFWLLFFHKWTLKAALPFQLSDLTVFLAAFMLFSKNRGLFSFLYFAGIGSSIQAMITPDLGLYSFPHYRYFEFYLSHGGVVLSCLFMIFTEKYRPSLFSLWMTIILINLYGVVMFLINRKLQANFLYIMEKPSNASLLNYLGPWPWYIISLEAVMIVSFFILYLPFWVKQKTA
ncbi:TIGR02206 family membrane protein [Metabacillus sp. RGM 3146]|uniref:YwaF family protein n=1 Tax=Metabacillus sp. RGM 3146 TaxID=3401092 RepID=UPI003B99B48C